MKKYFRSSLIIFTFFIYIDISANCEVKDFWSVQRKGANFFNKCEKNERMISAKELGVQFIRLAPNKWMNKNTKHNGDFLIGSEKNISSIPIESDVEYLKKVLDDADKANIKVVLVMLSLPYARWKQQSSNNIEERKIWEDLTYQDFIIEFWINLLKKIKDCKSLVGINLKNEPSPELTAIKFKDWYTDDYQAWEQSIRNTPQDLNLFYQKAVNALRKVDSKIPIVIESGFFATPWAFKILKPIEYNNKLDPNILYSFHMYEPYKYTSRFNKGKYTYPGYCPIGEYEKCVVYWDKNKLEEFLLPVIEFQKKYNIPDNQILVGEFGIVRINNGAEKYLKDLISIFNDHHWHWSFYSYREDTWSAMDYELGTDQKLGEMYWNDIDNNQIPISTYEKKSNNPLINVIKQGLK